MQTTEEQSMTPEEGLFEAIERTMPDETPVHTPNVNTRVSRRLEAERNQTRTITSKPLQWQTVGHPPMEAVLAAEPVNPVMASETSPLRGAALASLMQSAAKRYAPMQTLTGSPVAQRPQTRSASPAAVARSVQMRSQVVPPTRPAMRIGEPAKVTPAATAKEPETPAQPLAAVLAAIPQPVLVETPTVEEIAPAEEAAEQVMVRPAAPHQRFQPE